MTKRVAVVTGANRGIGFAASRLLAQNGFHVVLTSRSVQNGKAACLKLEEEGLDVSYIHLDVTDEFLIKQWKEKLEKGYGRCDVLVNNAGISIRHPFLDVTPDEWRTVMRVNLDGVFFVAQQAARRMKAAGSGVILNMGSTNGLMGYPFYADYNASKAGVIELTRSMALELAPAVRVNAVCPGYVMTPMQEAEYTPEMIAAVNAKIPLGRHGRPEEVAALFAFLASDEALFINGQTIVIDGAEIAGGLASR